MPGRSIAVALMLSTAAPVLAEAGQRSGPAGGSAVRAESATGSPADAAILPAIAYGRPLPAARPAGDVVGAPSGPALDIRMIGGVRLSLGAREIGNHVEFGAAPGSDMLAGGPAFFPQRLASLCGDDRIRSIAPTLTLGYARVIRRGLALGIDAGTMMKGLLNLSQPGAASGLNPLTLFDQQRAGLVRALSQFRAYPMLRLSLGLRF